MGNVPIQAPGDPGWWPSLKAGLRGPSKAPNKLAYLRATFSVLLLAPIGIGIVLSILYPELGGPEPLLGAALVGLYAVDQVVALLIGGRLTGATDPEGLAGKYATRFFLRYSMTVTPLLTGFIFSTIREELWPFAVMVPLFYLGMSLLAPTPANLEREQQRLLAAGSALSLVEALKTTASAPRTAA